MYLAQLNVKNHCSIVLALLTKVLQKICQKQKVLIFPSPPAAFIGQMTNGEDISTAATELSLLKVLTKTCL